MIEFCRTIPSEKVTGKHDLQFILHPGQSRAWESEKRIILVLAGAQSGKTALGPLWLRKEIQERGPGDYLVVTPTYPLLVKKALPEFLRLFRSRFRFGEFQAQQKIFTFSSAGTKRLFGKDEGVPTQVFFGHATDPESLESATVKAAWLDEAGQKKFKLESWEAINRRVAIHAGRILITTTPYSLGWLKQLLYDPWEAAKRQHPTIDVINFDSAENPSFPKEEFERARQTLPAWKFEMFYRGRFSRPAGLIYSSFNESRHKSPRFAIPPEWQRFVGLDFGGVNTAAVFFAEERIGSTPTGRLIAYREYKAGERSAAEHVYHLMKGEPRIPICAGGSKSEGQWRREFAQGGTANGERVPGLPIHGPAAPERESVVEVGINRVYAAFALNKLVIFDDLPLLLDQLGSYSRELDEMGEPTTKIDAKETFHFCFVAGTPITTVSSQVPIEHVKPGTTVLTRQGFRAVKAVGRMDKRPLREVTFSDGRSLVGTPDHPIWVQGKGFVTIDALRYLDAMLCQNETQEFAEKQSTVPVHVQAVGDAGTGTVYNLSVNDAHEYFANGILVSNCDAVRYIIGYLNRDKPSNSFRSPVARPGLQNL